MTKTNTDPLKKPGHRKASPMPVAFLKILPLLLLAGACSNPRASYTVGTSAAVGSAYLPTGVESGTSVAINYKERGGIVSRGVLATLVAFSAMPRTRTTTSTKSSVSYEGNYKVTKTTTTRRTTIIDSPEEIARKQAVAAATLKALGTSEIPFEFEFNWVNRKLGGDTDGYMAKMVYTSEPKVSGRLALRWLLGFGFGRYSFYERKQKRLEAQGDILMPTESLLEKTNYSYLGMPFRVEAALSGGQLFHFQADLNLRSVDFLFDDENSANPVHFGVGQRWGRLFLGSDLTVEKWRKDGLTAMLEASIDL